MCLTCDPQIADEILGYLVTHPEAQDTLEGIAGWWLLEQKINVQTALVKDALAGLVAEGLVVERPSGGARSYFKLNRRRYKRILARLNQEQGREAAESSPARAVKPRSGPGGRQ